MPPTETENRAAGRSEAPPAGPRRRALFARAVAWLVVHVYVAGMCAIILLERRLGLQGEDSLEGLIIFLGFGMFAVVGVLLVAKRPANLIGWTMSAIALIVGIFHASETYAAYVMTTRSRPDALAVAGVWVNCWYWLMLFALTFAYLPLLFPDGRLPSHRWLPVAVLQGIGSLGVVVLGALAETLRGQGFDYRIDNPIGIAIVRYRPYDIDLVIDRPLVYGSLTAVLAATYFGGPHQNMVAADHKRNGSRKTRGSVTF